MFQNDITSPQHPSKSSSSSSTTTALEPRTHGIIKSHLEHSPCFDIIFLTTTALLRVWKWTGAHRGHVVCLLCSDPGLLPTAGTCALCASAGGPHGHSLSSPFLIRSQPGGCQNNQWPCLTLGFTMHPAVLSCAPPPCCKDSRRDIVLLHIQ